MKIPLISICIPVYNTEQYLEECLKSVVDSECSNLEIIIIDDCSPGCDANGRNCKKIVKEFTRYCRKTVEKGRSVKVLYTRHSVNKGLVETRRNLVYEATGKYICMLDSDDCLTTDALSLLGKIAQEHDYDIIQGGSKPKKSNVYAGELNGNEIFHSFFVKQLISPFLWGKLIKREVYLEALSQIPNTYCNVAEDLLQFFFITRVAKSYFGTEQLVYFYRQEIGMTSNKVINDLRQWEMVCSTASVFAILFNWRNEQLESTGKDPLTDEELFSLQSFSYYYIRNNYLQYKNTVATEIKQQAYELLCEYWGSSFVKRIEDDLIEKNV